MEPLREKVVNDLAFELGLVLRNHLAQGEPSERKV
jgi:hypothetical protein